MKECWIDVPGGWFVMGGGPAPNENPAHRVYVDPFRLARTTVTQWEYDVFLRETGRAPAPCASDVPHDDATRPAIGVSWHDATAYCAWWTVLADSGGDTDSDGGGATARLPTEAEWECAARAGRGPVLYPWGDAPPETLPDYGVRWFDGPEPVDLYPTTHPLGIAGLGLNVHEWCADWYAAEFYHDSPLHRPTGPATGTRRASRGGSWRHAVKGTRCAARSSIPPDKRYADYGLRLACDAPCNTSPGASRNASRDELGD